MAPNKLRPYFLGKGDIALPRLEVVSYLFKLSCFRLDFAGGLGWLVYDIIVLGRNSSLPFLITLGS